MRAQRGRLVSWEYEYRGWVARATCAACYMACFGVGPRSGKRRGRGEEGVREDRRRVGDVVKVLGILLGAVVEKFRKEADAMRRGRQHKGSLWR
jgi:hypothetical protein